MSLTVLKHPIQPVQQPGGLADAIVVQYLDTDNVSIRSNAAISSAIVVCVARRQTGNVSPVAIDVTVR